MEDIFSKKKSHNDEKLKRGISSLALYCMLRGKRGETFWLSSLGQMIQFDMNFVELF